MLRQLRKKAQSTMEYAIVIGLVIAAAVGMQIYVKRGLQAKVKGAVDYNPDTTIFKTGQFEPNYSLSEMDTSRTVEESTETTGGGEVIRSIGTDGEVIKKSGTQTTTGLAQPTSE